MKPSTRIKIAPSQKQLGTLVPGSVFRTPAFPFLPQAFAAESLKLNERIFDESVQYNSLEMFREDPSAPLIYTVAGNPDDGRARLFAAYLVGLHLATHKNAHIEWHSVNGSFANPFLKEDVDGMSMIVLTNLSPVATQTKLDKVRDICEKYEHIPRVLVVAGEDPISFMATRVYLPCNAMAYFSDSMIKKRVEVL